MEAQQEVPINVNPEEIEGQLDPMNHPIPGESLTSEPGDKPFENAPHTNDAELVIDKAIQFFSDPEQLDILVSSLAAGMPVEAVVQTFALAGVSNGMFSPDVAELMKPALTIHIIQLALDNNIPIQIFTDEIPSEDERALKLQEGTMRAMKGSNPDLHRHIRGKQNLDKVKGRLEEIKTSRAAKERLQNIEDEIPMESDGSFLEMEEV